MIGSSNNGLQDLAIYVIAAIVALVMIVAVSEWLRGRRDRKIYKQTRRDANNTVMTQRQRRHGSANN